MLLKLCRLFTPTEVDAKQRAKKAVPKTPNIPSALKLGVYTFSFNIPAASPRTSQNSMASQEFRSLAACKQLIGRESRS